MKYIQFSLLNSYGRLANNLFEIAATIGLAKRYNANPLFPPNWNWRYHFNIPNEFFGEVKADVDVLEKVFHYVPDFLEDYKNFDVVNVTGTFQSEKYFDNCGDDIKKWIQPKGVKDLGDKSVGIHIRRGDYVILDCYVRYTPEYYLSAIEKYFSGKDYTFYICTDDPDYARIHFKGEQFKIAEREPVEDLKILCGCSGHILCNSSFSWWGAYLSNSKKTIRPPEIFAGKLAETHSEKDFWIEDWLCHEDFKIDLSDVTFIIPVSYDHRDRKENLDLTISMLRQAFNTNIIVGEQGTYKFDYTEKYCRYINFNTMKEFHRTKILNRMTQLAETPIVVNYDADVIFPPQQILNMVKMLRGEYDFVYPYSGAFLRVGDSTYTRNQEYIKSIQKSKDIGILKGIDFVGKDDKSVGGAIGYKKSSFIEAGMENENFIAYTPEDVERYHRFDILNYTIGRVPGPLYHLNHYCGEASLPSNPYFRAGQHELKKVKGMTVDNLKKYISTWGWVDKRKIYFITYADENYKDRQEILSHTATISGQVDKVIDYDREWLKTTKFYSENKHILNKERGSGYWLWKPYIILQTLKEVESSDIVFYLDSGDIIKGDIRSFLLEKMKSIDILLTYGAYPNFQWTKRDCFIKMGCDKNHYWDVTQLEAGVIVVKKTKFTVKILREWLYWCSKYEIIGDDKSKITGDFKDFKEHRHDQSILTNLKVKYDLYSSSEMREFIECNVDVKEQQPKIGIHPFKIIDTKDVTFVIPVKYDHPDRRENIDIVVNYLTENIRVNIIIEEQGGKHFKYLEQKVEYLHSELPIFYRTKIINNLVTHVKTPYAFLWDPDVITSSESLFDAIYQLKNGIDFIYPYNGEFIHVPRNKMQYILDNINNCEEEINNSQFSIQNSVGGAYGFKVESFIKAGMENEYFVRYGWEDREREARFIKLGFEVGWTSSPLYHFDHFKGKDSQLNNPDHIINRHEFNKVHNMTKEELEKYISTWKWVQKT